jgi:hypothetical protein
MDVESTLQTIAQIGVSLAGFAGIVGAMAGERVRPEHPEVWLPFWAMISSGLGVAFSALFPFLPRQFSASDPVVWATSSAFLGLVTATNLASFLPRILRAARLGRFRRMRAISVPLDTSCLLVIFTQLLNTLGIGFAQSTAGFLIGLYLILLVSALNFVFLLYVLGRPLRND